MFALRLADFATLANICWGIFGLSTFQDGSWIATNNDRQVQYDLPSPEVVVCWGAKLEMEMMYILPETNSSYLKIHWLEDDMSFWGKRPSFRDYVLVSGVCKC